MNVATKELKNRLSHYLRLVEHGERIVVTAHGRPVATLSSANRGPSEAVLADLEAEGIATRGGGRFTDFKPARSRGTPLSKMILDERR